jgi:hypothetical protein
MKNLFGYLSLLLLGGLLFTSCSEEIDLIDGFEETAIVYGLLDQGDTIHYIKINRAFIGPGNSLDIAKEPDSSYFDNDKIVAQIKEDGGANRTWILKDTLIENKNDNGIWYAPLQRVYYFKTTSSSPLDINSTYKLSLSINNGEILIFGETKLVKGISVSTSNSGFSFAKDPGEYNNTSVSVGTGNAAIINTQLEVHFKEFDGVDFSDKSFSWNLGESEVAANSTKGFPASGETFYTLVKQNVSNNVNITRRLFSGFYITIVGGTEELYNYITVNKPASTLAQNKPVYTNLKVKGAKRVIGIFSARQTYKIYKPFYVSSSLAYIRAIDKKSTRELCDGPITGDFFFCSDHPGDNIMNQEEFFACQ